MFQITVLASPTEPVPVTRYKSLADARAAIKAVLAANPGLILAIQDDTGDVPIVLDPNGNLLNPKTAGV